MSRSRTTVKSSDFLSRNLSVIPHGPEGAIFFTEEIKNFFFLLKAVRKLRKKASVRREEGKASID